MTPVRIAIGQFMEESNTFVRQQADLDHFRATQLLYGNEVLPLADEGVRLLHELPDRDPHRRPLYRPKHQSPGSGP